jgi:hypothetical protein
LNFNLHGDGGVLYLTRNGLLEPLGQSQIWPYLRGLSRDHRITLISFEKPADRVDSSAIQRMRSQCASHGMRWIPLQFRSQPRPWAPALAIPQPRPWLALTLAFPYLVMVVAMGYTRQAVAIGVECLALLALERDRLLVFLGWIALAATFHKTALVLMVLPASTLNSNLRFSQLIRLGLLATAGFGLFNSLRASY